MIARANKNERKRQLLFDFFALSQDLTAMTLHVFYFSLSLGPYMVLALYNLFSHR
jgi:hypothetical protein